MLCQINNLVSICLFAFRLLSLFGQAKRNSPHLRKAGYDSAKNSVSPDAA